MAKTSKIKKNEQRRRTAERLKEKRVALLAVYRDTNRPFEERDEALRKLKALPRDANPNRIRNRCAMTGRPRAFYRKFGLSRVTFRELALQAEIPGVRKASW